MALFAVSNDRLASREKLLVDLVHTVGFLLDSGSLRHSVFFWRSSLGHLHSRVKAILRHGARVRHHLIFAQPSFAAFDTWLESKLADHSLVDELKRVHEDIREFYYEWAFLQETELFQAFTKSLFALSTRDFEDIVDVLTIEMTSPIVPEVLVIDSTPVKLGSDVIARLTENKDGHCNVQQPSTSFSRIKLEEDKRVMNYGDSVDETDDGPSNKLSVPAFSYSVSPISSPPNFSMIDKAASIADQSSSTSSYSSSSAPVISIDAPTVTCTSDVEAAAGISRILRKTPSKFTKSLSPTFSEALSAELKKTPKSFLESGGFLQPPALGHFPLPQKGQSLTSFLSSLSDTMPELDRENAHFNVSEALISAFERLKVARSFTQYRNHVEDLDEMEDMYGTVDPDVSVDPDRPENRQQQFLSPSPRVGCSNSRKFYSGRRFPRPPILHTETEESEMEYWKQQPRKPPLHRRKKPKLGKLGSDGRSDDVFSTTEVSASVSSESSTEEDIASSSFSAENVALKLLRNAKMKDEHLPLASELQWLVSEIEAPQTLLPLPKNWTSASESESEYSLKIDSAGKLDKTMRLRGTCDWAPPRPQIIFTIHPDPNPSVLTSSQRYRCAGCGMKVDPKYVSTFRYCFYLGRYFCTGCHTQKRARLPQMILNKWDFGSYMVSNFSYSLLENLYSDPVYNALAINPNLTKKVKLNNFRNYRIQLGFLQEYLQNCKLADSLHQDFKKLPTYYTSDVDLFSLEDLINVRFSVGMPILIKDFVAHAIHHVLHCELCRNLGFVCEICKRNEILFPFQINRVSRCPRCSSCYHLKCFNPNSSDCPKCLRVTTRRNTLEELEVFPASIAV